MPLELGKSFNRSYSIRIPILDGYYNISIYFNKKSTFLLFKVEPDFVDGSFDHNIKISMHKNLESSKFCETFIKLHNFKKETLDIVNQYEKINDNYTDDISFVLNESLVLSKIQLDDGKDVYDTLNIYGFTMNSYAEDYVFLITERHNILKRLGKKIVRTSGLQIATSGALQFLDEYHEESKLVLKSNHKLYTDPNKTIKLTD